MYQMELPKIEVKCLSTFVVIHSLYNNTPAPDSYDYTCLPGISIYKKIVQQHPYVKYKFTLTKRRIKDAVSVSLLQQYDRYYLNQDYMCISNKLYGDNYISNMSTNGTVSFNTKSQYYR